MMNDDTPGTHRPHSAATHKLLRRMSALAALAPILLVVVGLAKASAKPSTHCGTNQIGVHGPTTNRANTFFTESISGCATGQANHVISGEQRVRARGCARTYRAEASASSNFYQWPTGTGQVHGRFSLAAKFYAQNPGTHGICSYLINRTTHQTYAHTERFWTNS